MQVQSSQSLLYPVNGIERKVALAVLIPDAILEFHSTCDPSDKYEESPFRRWSIEGGGVYVKFAGITTCTARLILKNKGDR
jgi:hypothetical protein